MMAVLCKLRENIKDEVYESLRYLNPSYVAVGTKLMREFEAVVERYDMYVAEVESRCDVFFAQ